MNKTSEKIDFVVTYLDSTDKKWQEERAKYSGEKLDSRNSEARYRNMDNFQHWFRSVERYAPWVHKIHIVTWGHVPEWLDTTNPKINIVKHDEYIPEKYLPTFNSNVLDLNLDRIEGLSEKFVYFNDDMFVTNYVKPAEFFKNGIPRDVFALNCIYFGKKSAGFFNGNDVELINIHFDKKECMRKNFCKWFSPVNGWKSIVRTTALAFIWKWFPGFYYNHLPSNFLKSTFEEVWGLEEETLRATCMDKFRTKSNCNQWLMKFWQLASGNFIPRSMKIGKCFHIKDRTFPSALEAIRTGKYKLICLNDTIYTSDFEKQKAQAIEAFEQLLPEKSSFEK